MLLRYTAALVAVFALNACGKSELTDIKNFKFFVETDDVQNKETVQFLMDRYNSELGAPVLFMVETKEESNSTISFSENLKLDSEEKLGVGRWITVSSHHNEYTIKGFRSKTQVEHGMELSFDRKYFESKRSNVTNLTSSEAMHLFHLFCHEVGHGMRMDHSSDNQNVMYPSIANIYKKPVNYDAYFRDIKTFMTESQSNTK